MKAVFDRSSRVRQAFFGDARPASTLIGVRELAVPGMRVEIEAVVGLSRGAYVMDILLPTAASVAELLKARHETIAVAESSAGGLLSAALVAQPGASAYFIGSAIVYTGAAKQALLNLPTDAPRSASEAYAIVLARTLREKLGADWALVETGASGPSGNRYGDAAGHCCIAVVGPMERVITIETGLTDRVQNMRRFAYEALTLLQTCLAGYAS